jgi:hypothetical protein
MKIRFREDPKEDRRLPGIVGLRGFPLPVLQSLRDIDVPAFGQGHPVGCLVIPRIQMKGLQLDDGVSVQPDPQAAIALSTRISL